MKIHGKTWKPQKLPNDASGEVIDIEARFQDIAAWLLSQKYEGVRSELIDGQSFSREMNLSPNIEIQRMADKFFDHSGSEGIIEAEFFAPGMNFSEISHFYKTEDVTSKKTMAKYNLLWKKTAGGTQSYKATVKGVIVDKFWPYPGRDLAWVTSWHPELKFYMFDHVYENDTRTKEERYADMYIEWMSGRTSTDQTSLIAQWTPKRIDCIYQAYDEVMVDGGEGLVAMKKKSLYKPGRITLASSQGFKIKDNNVEFYGTIISVEEGTIAREGSVKTVSHFGRSKTSQLKEDRIPSGLAKGFMVKWEGDGREFLVPIAGFDHPARIQMLNHPTPWIGKRIKFVGMHPTKIGGLPRSVHYTREDD